MKASELIQRLETAIELHGDLPISVEQDGELLDAHTLVLVEDEDESGKVEGFMIADEETALAFMDGEEDDDGDPAPED